MCSRSVTWASRSGRARREASRPRWIQSLSAQPRPSKRATLGGVEAREHAQRLQGHHADAVGRVAQRGHPAVVERQRRAPVGGVRGQVGRTRWVRLGPRSSRPSSGDRARVGRLRTLGEERAQRSLERGQSHDLPGSTWPVVRPVDARPSPRRSPKIGAERSTALEPARPRPGSPRRGRWRAPAGRSSRDVRSVGALHPTSGPPPGTVIDHGPRSGMRSWPAARAASMVAPPPARPLPLSVTGLVALRVPDDPEGVAAEPAAVSGHDREGGVGGDGSVDGAATGAQHQQARLRGQMVRAGDGSMAAAHGAGRRRRGIGRVGHATIMPCPARSSELRDAGRVTPTRAPSHRRSPRRPRRPAPRPGRARWPGPGRSRDSCATDRLGRSGRRRGAGQPAGCPGHRRGRPGSRCRPAARTSSRHVTAGAMVRA